MRTLTLTAWCAALFAASTLFSHDVALRLVLLALGFVLACTAALTQRRELHLLPPIWWAFVLWATWAALTLVWSVDPERSYKEFVNEVVYVAMACFVCYIGAQAPRAARIVLSVLAASAVLLCGLAIQYHLVSPDPFVEGWQGGPGHLSSTLLMLLPIATAVAWYGRWHSWRPIYPWLALLVALLILVGAYTTQNRTVWIGFTAQLLLLLCLVALRSRNAPRGVPWPVVLAMAVVLAAGLAMTAVVNTERVETSSARPIAKDPRFALWSETLDYIAERPLTGYGFGRGLLRKQLREDTGDQMLWHSHNLFLDAALQTGIPGLALFLVLLASTLREGWRLARHPSDAVAFAGIVLIAIVSGMVIRNMTDLLFLRHNALFYWGAVGLLLGCGRARRAPAES